MPAKVFEEIGEDLQPLNASEAELIRRNEEIDEKESLADLSYFESLPADSLVFTRTTGVIQHKADYLQGLGMVRTDQAAPDETDVPEPKGEPQVCADEPHWHERHMAPQMSGRSSGARFSSADHG